MTAYRWPLLASDGARDHDTLYALGLSVDRVSDRDKQRLWSACDAHELERSRRFAFERDRTLYLLAHGLLRRGLSRCDPSVAPEDWRFVTGPYGRPSLAPFHHSSIAFNISHCPNRVMCVISGGQPCGVDVEDLKRPADHDLLADTILTPIERSWMRAAEPGERSRRFLRLWTMKEAIAKAVGLGLRLSFSDLEIDLRSRPVLVKAPDLCRGRWQLWQQASLSEHVDSVAVQCASDLPIRLVRRELGGEADDLSFW